MSEAVGEARAGASVDDDAHRRVHPVAFWLTVAAAVVGFAGPALTLVGYPFDWSPEEGLALDYARRVWTLPSSLYPESGTVVPFPLAYTPLYPLLLAPIVALLGPSILAARVVDLAILAVLVVALVRLIGGSRRVALFAVCAALANGKMFAYLAVVRVDLLMIAAMLWFLVVALPVSATRGAGALSWPRALLAALVVVIAMLAKPTAIVYVLPACAAWLVVDMRSAVRLAASCSVLLVVAGGVLELATAGGFSATLSTWGTHPALPHRVPTILAATLRIAWPTLVPAAVVVVVAGSARARVLRDGSVLLIASALSVLPLVFKAGAFYSYFIPPMLGVCVFVGRALSLVEASRARQIVAWSLTGSAFVAAALRPLPLPDDGDLKTATAFYGFIAEVASIDERPIIATRPDFAYVVAERPVEIEGTGFMHLLRAGARDADSVVTRARGGAYALVVADVTYFAAAEELLRATHAAYVPVAACGLGSMHGPTLVYVFRPRGADGPPFGVEPGVRCQRSPPMPPSFCAVLGDVPECRAGGP